MTTTLNGECLCCRPPHGSDHIHDANVQKCRHGREWIQRFGSLFMAAQISRLIARPFTKTRDAFCSLTQARRRTGKSAGRSPTRDVGRRVSRSPFGTRELLMILVNVSSISSRTSARRQEERQLLALLQPEHIHSGLPGMSAGNHRTLGIRRAVYTDYLRATLAADLDF